MNFSDFSSGQIKAAVPTNTNVHFSQVKEMFYFMTVSVRVRALLLLCVSTLWLIWSVSLVVGAANNQQSP